MVFMLRIFVGVPLAFALAYVFFLFFERPYLKGKSKGRTNERRLVDAEIARDAAASPAP